MSQDTVPTSPGDSDSPAAVPSLTQEQLDEMDAIVAELQARFAGDAGLATDLEAILRKYLHRPITPATNQAMGWALEIAVGFDNARRLIDLLRSSDPEYLKALQRVATPELWQWLRRQFAVYGSDLQEAYTVWNENANGWKDANRRAVFDFVGQRWWVSLQINKYDGAIVFLEDTPRAMLVLASGIIDTLNSIPADQLREVLPSEGVADLQRVVARLGELTAPPDDEEATADGDAVNGAVT